MLEILIVTCYNLMKSVQTSKRVKLAVTDSAGEIMRLRPQRRIKGLGGNIY